jgi:hypothetical protein
VWTFKNILCLGKTSKKALRFLKFWRKLVKGRTIKKITVVLTIITTTLTIKTLCWWKYYRNMIGYTAIEFQKNSSRRRRRK